MVKAKIRKRYVTGTYTRCRKIPIWPKSRESGKKSGDISSVSREKQRMKFQAETASLEGQMLNCSLLSAPRG